MQYGLLMVPDFVYCLPSLLSRSTAAKLAPLQQVV